MSDTVEHSAKAILTEALDTIKATFWVAGKEFALAQAEAEWNETTKDYDYDWKPWEEISKAFVIDVGDDGPFESYKQVNDGKVKITGVCSIGALALANVTLYDEPISHWEDICGYDPHTFLAGAVLANEIVKDGLARPVEGEEGHDPFNPHINWRENRNENGSIIAAWNDYPGRTREQVIEMFDRALASPLLTAEQIYGIVYSGSLMHSSQTYHVQGVYFPSQQEAEDFWTSSNELTRYLRSWLGTCVATIAPVELPGRVSA